MVDIDKTKQTETFTNTDPESLPEELKTIYKGMQADYTRKTQAIADERKTFSTERSNYETGLQDLGSLRERVTQWESWYEGLQKTIEQENNDKKATKSDAATGVDYLQENSPETTKIIQGFQSKITDLELKLDSAYGAIKDSGEQVNRMFDYHAQLTELSAKHPNLEKSKLLDHALKSGQRNLTKAYEDLYRDDIIKSQVEERLKEELDKRKTDGIKFGGQPMIIRTREAKPKSFADATAAILQQKSAAGTLD